MPTVSMDYVVVSRFIIYTKSFYYIMISHTDCDVNHPQPLAIDIYLFWKYNVLLQDYYRTINECLRELCVKMKALSAFIMCALVCITVRIFLAPLQQGI